MTDQDPLAGLKAATEHLSKDTPDDEAKRIIKAALPLLVDLLPTDLEDAISYLEELCCLPKKWMKAYQREVKYLRKKPLPPQQNIDPSPEKELIKLRPEAKKLANSPDVLGEVVEVLRALGVAGQEREIKLLYLAMTTRIFSRPVNVAAKGPSSGGKSHLTESVLKLFPDQSYYALSAMSEKALAYSQELLAHRFLMIYEAAGLGSEFSQYLMRSLLSEGRVRYETVEKTRDGLISRLIEREGPTGLIVTTTRTGLHPENENRLLSIEVDDSPEQTRSVLLAQADGNPSGPGPDLAPFHAFQRILEIEKPEVVVPFAYALAEGCDPQAVRLRRDFPALLTLIKAHTLIHSVHRNKDAEGRIIAEPNDYTAVFDLVADLIAQGTGAKIDKRVREAVAAVESLADEEGITVKALAKDLGMHHLRVWRLVQKALKGAFLINKETRKGAPARLVIGDPLPPDGVVLPHPKKLFQSYRHQNDENLKTRDFYPMDSGCSSFHPHMKTNENCGEHDADASQSKTEVFIEFSTRDDKDNKLNYQDNEGEFSSFQSKPEGKDTKKMNLLSTRTWSLNYEARRGGDGIIQAGVSLPTGG
jgi:hypothetical protein